ncbi:MAG: winged helix-turn-helix transcriptional regulator [Geodermatophilaceae bacterium]|nr:winged helix-turn-helix transcriptional regulator [Geodermatophilaceae bacterium]
MVILGERAGGSLRVRLAGALSDAVRSGRIAPGTTLPSFRVLARDLGLSRGVVVDAYSQLAAEGFLRSRPGRPPWWAFTRRETTPVVDPDPPAVRPGPIWIFAPAARTSRPFCAGRGTPQPTTS